MFAPFQYSCYLCNHTERGRSYQQYTCMKEVKEINQLQLVGLRLVLVTSSDIYFACGFPAKFAALKITETLRLLFLAIFCVKDLATKSFW